MAADNGDIRSMNNYAFLKSKGKGVSINKQSAISNFQFDNDDFTEEEEEEEEGNDSSDIDFSDDIYFDDYYSSGDNSEIFDEYLDTVDSDDDSNKITSIDEESKCHAEQCKKEADEGNIHSMVKYAMYCYEGLFVQGNKKEAFTYFKLAADKGNLYSDNPEIVYTFFLT